MTLTSFYYYIVVPVTITTMVVASAMAVKNILDFYRAESKRGKDGDGI